MFADVFVMKWSLKEQFYAKRKRLIFWHGMMA